MGNQLGDQLRTVRQIRGGSLKAVADRADISPAYLQKLEGGGVRQPSPNVLHRLARVLGIAYADLMRLAGYVVPKASGDEPADSFDHALSSADLTDDERKAVAAFISHLRDQRE